MAKKLAVILSKDRAGQTEHEHLEKKILAGLEGRQDLKVTVLPHLYDLSNDGPGMQFLRSVEGDLVILTWLYPRSAYWVLAANGIQGSLGPTFSLAEEPDAPAASDERTIWSLDLRSENRPEPYLKEIDRIASLVVEPVAVAAHEANGKSQFVDESALPRWYPVIDFSRCGDCLECLNFCLFGVFGVDDDGRPMVEQPDACRPGCPACSRICPEGAIMFPQHNDPAIAGDPERSRKELKLDLSQLFRGADPREIAEAERKRALQRQHPRQPDGSTPDGPAAESLDNLVDRIDDMDL